MNRSAVAVVVLMCDMSALLSMFIAGDVPSLVTHFSHSLSQPGVGREIRMYKSYIFKLF
jgi:hypothetical protein